MTRRRGFWKSRPYLIHGSFFDYYGQTFIVVRSTRAGVWALAVETLPDAKLEYFRRRGSGGAA